jgi:hypothetical protein
MGRHRRQSLTLITTTLDAELYCVRKRALRVDVVHPAHCQLADVQPSAWTATYTGRLLWWLYLLAGINARHRRCRGPRRRRQKLQEQQILRSLRTQPRSVVVVVVVVDAPRATCPKRLLIEARWGPKPLAFAGQLQPRRLNK